MEIQFEELEERIITCPYCRKVDKHSWEYAKDDYFEESHQCGYCDRKFELSVQVKILYLTKPRCKSNDEFCEFSGTPDYTSSSGKFFHCKICGADKREYSNKELRADWEKRTKPYKEGPTS